MIIPSRSMWGSLSIAMRLAKLPGSNSSALTTR